MSDFPVSVFLEWLSRLDLPLVAEVLERSGIPGKCQFEQNLTGNWVAKLAPQADWLSNSVNGVHSLRE